VKFECRNDGITYTQIILNYYLTYFYEYYWDGALIILHTQLILDSNSTHFIEHYEYCTHATLFCNYN